MHQRFLPRVHRFRYRIHYLYLDLGELDQVFQRRWLWSMERPNFASFYRKDYFGDPQLTLEQAVRIRVETELGRAVSGPIRVLTHPRYFGYVFNPVTFYYCYAEDGVSLEAVLSEITNTPWRERYSYVVDLTVGETRDGLRHTMLDKKFHVSPFFDLDHRYDWGFSDPSDSLQVWMQNYHDGERVFESRLLAERRALTGPQLAGALLRNPCVTAVGHLAIYWQAARLWAKRVPFFPHPDKRKEIGALP